jgi:uncharacterized protein (DUF983 family)
MDSKSYRRALLHGKCPACREGAIFKYPLSQLARFSEMHSQCPVCGAGFEPEPGFYFGSMFITYAFNVVLVVIIGVLFYYFWALPEWLFLIIVLVAAVGAMPFSFRASRTLWLYWFGGLHYRGSDRRS